MDSLKTKRLTLREPLASDAEAIASGLNDFSVSKWLAPVPHPYDLRMAEEWLVQTTTGAPHIAMICIAEKVIGAVDARNGILGYWLLPAYWGQGIMTEAASAMRDCFFKTTEDAVLKSGFFAGNTASRNVLGKLGFEITGEDTEFNAAQNAELAHVTLELTRAKWETLQ